jgi:hypothetical protein
MNYQKIYNQIIKRAKTNQQNGYKEIHHIIPKCLGGSNKKENLVELTAREHFLCHMLLCEIYPNENKLKHALFLMSIGKQKAKVNQYAIGSRVYERLKKEHSEFLTGKKQSEETKNKKSESMKKVWLNKSQSEMSKIGKKRAESRKEKGEWHSNEWKNNMKKIFQNRDMSKASNARKKIVLQYDLDGNFIKEWESASEAERNIGGDIKACCNNKQKTAAGFIWKYKNN